MVWDNSKTTEDGDGTVDSDEQLSADEWNQHVTDGHFPADEVNFGVDNGDPVMTDPQNADEVIARYDRSEGAWVFTAVNTENLLSIKQLAPIADTGDGSEASPYVVPSAVLDGVSDPIKFNTGWYDTDGLATDPSVDYEEDAIWLVGDGTRSSTLQHVDGTSPTVLWQAGGNTGNFGGIRDMTIYGAGQDVGSANIVESNGNIIDLTLENTIVRYGGGDAVNIQTSGSGTRIVNCWLENVSGRGLFVESGTRLKISNVHFFGNGGRDIQFEASNSQLTGITSDSAGSNGVEIIGSANQLSDFLIKDSAVNGLAHSGSNNAYSSGSIAGTSTHGIRAGADWGTFYNIQLSNIGGDIINIPGGSNNQFAVWDLNGTGTVTITSTASDNRIYCPGLTWSRVTDNGTRTVINGVGLNAGDPNTTGDWNGNGYEGVKVRDTTNADTYLYNNGIWSQIASA